ncbi:fasciclin domain-containing protein [Zobellia alginiliquefaciens]|uniref:fasciclin domain-containing protein n=1 Tax=Zobellia alginiliquefaciens TaxID=3032586 RepID=UPI0023E15D17|nr:fasciclin domain-containing protein [Zobellia alginiliquefaciens]
MKKTFTNFVTIAITTILCGFSGIAQSDAILSEVENSETYETIDLLIMDKELSTFANLAMLSGLGNSMKATDEGHTLFAPTNDAFRDMSIKEFSKLTNPKNKSELVTFVKSHILPNKYMSNEFEDRQVMSVGGDNEVILSKDSYDNVYIGGAKIVKPNIEASNGVIHVVNSVIDSERSITNR